MFGKMAGQHGVGVLAALANRDLGDLGPGDLGDPAPPGFAFVSSLCGGDTSTRGGLLDYTVLHTQTQTLVMARPNTVSRLGAHGRAVVHLGQDPELVLAVHPHIQHLAHLPVPIVVVQDRSASHRLPRRPHTALGQLRTHIALGSCLGVTTPHNLDHRGGDGGGGGGVFRPRRCF